MVIDNTYIYNHFFHSPRLASHIISYPLYIIWIYLTGMFRNIPISTCTKEILRNCDVKRRLSERKRTKQQAESVFSSDRKVLATAWSCCTIDDCRITFVFAEQELFELGNNTQTKTLQEWKHLRPNDSLHSSFAFSREPFGIPLGQTL